MNIGFSFAWRRATIRENWRSVVGTATLKRRRRIYKQQMKRIKLN